MQDLFYKPQRENAKRNFYETLMPTLFLATLIFLLIFVIIFTTLPAHGESISLPGDDISSKMESAGTLLRFIDTALFKWTARILSGVCMFGTAWCFKEQRIGTGVVVLIAALLFGTSTMWVKNIFSAAGGDSVFSLKVPLNQENYFAHA